MHLRHFFEYTAVGRVAAVVATLFSSNLQAAVNFVQLSPRTNPPGFYFGVGSWTPTQLPWQDFDINQDGQMDFYLTASLDHITTGVSVGVGAIIPLGSTAQLFGNRFPLHLTGPEAQATAFFPGEMIGADSTDLFVPGLEHGWHGADYRINYLSLLWPPLKLLTGTVQYGQFVGKERFLGFRLLEEDGWHYGWLHIEGGAFFGVVVLEYAYETEPNTPILARNIPEPTAASLALLVACLALRRRRSLKAYLWLRSTSIP